MIPKKKNNIIAEFFGEIEMGLMDSDANKRFFFYNEGKDFILKMPRFELQIWIFIFRLYFALYYIYDYDNEND